MQDLGGLPCDDKPTKGSTSSFSLVVACLSVSYCNTFVEFIWKWKWTGVGFSCFSWTTLRFLEGSVPPGPLPSSYSLPLPICIRSVLILFQCLYLDHCNPKNHCLIFVNIMKSCLWYTMITFVWCVLQYSRDVAKPIPNPYPLNRQEKTRSWRRTPMKGLALVSVHWTLFNFYFAFAFQYIRIPRRPCWYKPIEI